MTPDARGPADASPERADASPERADASPERDGQVKGSAPRPLIVGTALATIGWIAVLALLRFQGYDASAVPRFFPLLLGGAAVTAMVLALVRQRQGPPRFVLSGRAAFVAPTSPTVGHAVVGLVLMLGFLAGQTVLRRSGPAGGDADPALIDQLITATLWVLLVALGAVTALRVVAVLAGRPRVELTARAVVLRDHAGSRTIPWQALRPGVPPRQEGRPADLPVDHPTLVDRRGLTTRSNRVNPVEVHVHPQFLVDAITYYVARPDRRDAIGTEAEYDRLLTDLGCR